MRNLRRKSAGGPVDGITAPRRSASRAVRPLTLACLVLATTVLVGCQSGPCGGGPCGGSGSTGLWSGMKNGVRSMTDTVKNTTAKVFHHKSSGGGGCSTCGDGMVEGVPMEGAVISGGSMPGPVVAPPASESAPTILEPAAPAGTSSGAATKGKSSSNVNPSSLKDAGNKQSAVYPGRTIESNSVGRGENLARAALRPSAPSAGGLSFARGTNLDTTAEKNPLDNVPPIDLSEEVARRGQGSTVPVEADLIKTPATVDKPVTASLSPPVPATADDVELPAIKAGLQTAAQACLKHFSPVKPKLNGGSLPSAEGLTWLKDRGIRTLLDLREPSEVDSKFVDTTKSLGFRYVSLAVNPAKLDAATLNRFAEEINKSDGQPVYFFDTDGNRAGLAWYLHRLTVDKVDAQIASREAEEIGVSDKSIWVPAGKFIDTTKPKADAKPTAAAAVAPPIKVEAPALAIPSPSAKKPTVPSAGTPSAWRSSAALIMTGLSTPVVDWTSTVINVSREASANPTAKAH